MDLRLKLVTTSLDVKGGANRVILKMAQQFRAPIYCLEYKAEKNFDEFSDFEIITPKTDYISKLANRNQAVNTLNACNYFKKLKFGENDIVSAHLPPSNWTANLNRTIWYVHSLHPPWAFELYEWKLNKMNSMARPFFKLWTRKFRKNEIENAAKSRHIFTNSRYMERKIKDEYGLNSEILYPGINSGDFRCRDYEKFFFYPSRFSPEKNFEYVVDAFGKFSLKNKGWKLILAGSTSDFPEHEAYLRKIKTMQNDSISIEINLSEERLRELYSHCYAVLYPPLNEPYGLVPLEALASSKPVIARNEGGPRETVSDGVDGFLVDSPAEMAEKMEWLAQNPDACEKMGRAGKEKVNKYFTWDYFLKRFEEKAVEVGNEGNAHSP